MPNPKLTRVYFEGNDDKAFLEQLRAAGMCPEAWEFAVRKDSGKDGLVRELLPFVSPTMVGGHAVVLVDFDDLTEEELAEWFKKCIEQELKKKDASVRVEGGPVKGRVRSFHLIADDRLGKIALVGVGCQDHDELKSTYKIDRFAIDDWVFRLALNQGVYESVSEFSKVSYLVATQKYVEVAVLFRKNGLEVRTSKTYLRILRALVAREAATATIVGRLVKKAVQTLGEARFRELLQPFLDDLQAAADLLSTDPPPSP